VTKEINLLIEKINKLKSKRMKAETRDEELKLDNEIMEIKIKANELIISSKKKRPGITARELLSKSLKDPIYYQTGIPAIDKMGGIPLGALVQIAASSGAGKTTMMLKILSVFSNNMRVVHFDFEMGEYKIARKLKWLLKTDKQKDNYIIDFESYRLDDLVREIELYSAEGIKFFVVDSKMKIEVPGNLQQFEQASKISLELQRLCRENDITIMMINQMSEESIKFGRPALKGGNDQQYDADVIYFIYKMVAKKGENGIPDEIDKSKRVFVVGKNRFGEEYVDEILREHVESYTANSLKVNIIKEYDFQQEPTTTPEELSQDVDEIDMPTLESGLEEDEDFSDFPF